MSLAMLGFLVLMLFSWTALKGLVQPDRTGALGRVALRVASFPWVVERAWNEAAGLITGTVQTKSLSVPRPDFDEAGFRPVRMADGTPLSGLIVRGEASKADRGWRLLTGAMHVDGHPAHVAALLDPELRVVRRWTLDETDVPGADPNGDSNILLHGLAMLPDESLVFAFDNGAALQRRDACNRPVWVVPGRYHHSVTLGTEGRSLWALRDDGFAPMGPDPDAPDTGLVQIDLATGAVLREIGVGAIMAANPGLGLFELGRLDENEVQTNAAGIIGRWQHDPVHFNDIEPLTPAMAGAFPGFEAGDLLISARNLNTVMVLDPDSLKIRWYRTGGMLRQHDPDWQADGTITVFDNAMGTGVSRILALDPAQAGSEVLHDGAETGFYTRIRGKHTRTARGDLAIVSPQQGRAFELAADGAKVLEFFNLKPGSDDEVFVLSEYLWFPEAAVSLKEETCLTD
ncbi:hypothetical protein EJA01_02850 [Rhodovulum iodosum]|uniref:arylsulfotransferase family protein n=1 Tax=Rhodovulum iodosum TaxID=68291 RepID=UPI000F6825F9|nr:hypothetical protein EJA01_02850 [Rhodovulum robiginosum]